MTSVLVVEDDTHMWEMISMVLNHEGFRVRGAVNGKEALAEMESAPPDLVLLDIMMPIMDGWDLCQELRRLNPELPIIMITAKHETSQKVKGFGLGADDYLVKPFDPQELVARIKAVMRRYRIAADKMVRLGSLKLDRLRGTISDGKINWNLPLKEFELLYQLASYPGQIFMRDQLIEAIWGFDHEGDERTVDVHIKRLRERFSTYTHLFRIVTVRGLGYRLVTESYD
ncbi:MULTISPECIES: response regulator transcription factor [unclassified Paenibacillus]|uniref:response regulator transcription factor n=1 Tax=unclassified Paenibacillus TaxID=185978 RepID=UPI0008398445|nr:MULTISPECIES: response regulator transcription factor [unclassified Paenibacillus]NWL89460.1 DNA-binding response regulator [Paenibacillus sp. 79R4]